MPSLMDSRMTNDPRLANLFSPLVPASFFLVVMIISALYGYFYLPVIAAIICIATLLNGFDIEYLRRPRSIIVKNDGIIMQFRTRADCIIEWEHIEYLDVNRDTTHRPLDEIGSSALRVKKGARIGDAMNKGCGLRIPVFPLRYEIAETIRERFKEAMGTYPPTSKEVYRQKKARNEKMDWL